MIREIEKSIDGQDIVILTPENEADERELERMEREGKIDGRESFADADDVTEQDLIRAGFITEDE